MLRSFKPGIFNGIYAQQMSECGGNRELALEKVANQLDSMFLSGSVNASNINLSSVFKEVVDPQGRFSEKSDTQKIAEAVQSTAFPTISNSVIHGTIIPAYEIATGDVVQLVTERPASKTRSEDIVGFNSLDDFAAREESMPYEETTIQEKKVTIKTKDFGRIIELTREAIFDDRTNELVNRARRLGELGGRLRAIIITKTIEGLHRTEYKETTTTPGFFTYEGTSLTQSQFYSSDHSAVADGMVNANVSTLDLSHAGLDDIELNFSNLVNEKNQKIGSGPTTLFLPQKKWNTGRKLIQSPTDHETTAQDINPHRGAYNPIKGLFLSNQENYYLGDFKSQLIWLWVWEPETRFQDSTSESAFERNIVLRYRFNWNGGCGHQDYRFIHRGGTA